MHKPVCTQPLMRYDALVEEAVCFRIIEAGIALGVTQARLAYEADAFCGLRNMREIVCEFYKICGTDPSAVLRADIQRIVSDMRAGGQHGDRIMASIRLLVLEWAEIAFSQSIHVPSDDDGKAGS